MLKYVDKFTAVYDETPSCIAMASAIIALAEARGARPIAVAYGEALAAVENPVLIMGPLREGLAERALDILSRRRFGRPTHSSVLRVGRVGGRGLRRRRSEGDARRSGVL